MLHCEHFPTRILQVEPLPKCNIMDDYKRIFQRWIGLREGKDTGGQKNKSVAYFTIRGSHHNENTDVRERHTTSPNFSLIWERAIYSLSHFPSFSRSLSWVSLVPSKEQAAPFLVSAPLPVNPWHTRLPQGWECSHNAGVSPFSRVYHCLKQCPFQQDTHQRGPQASWPRRPQVPLRKQASGPSVCKLPCPTRVPQGLQTSIRCRPSRGDEGKAGDWTSRRPQELSVEEL